MKIKVEDLKKLSGVGEATYKSYLEQIKEKGLEAKEDELIESNSVVEFGSVNINLDYARLPTGKIDLIVAKNFNPHLQRALAKGGIIIYINNSQKSKFLNSLKYMLNVYFKGRKNIRMFGGIEVAFLAAYENEDFILDLTSKRMETKVKEMLEDLNSRKTSYVLAHYFSDTRG